jgi:hypothetical protein
MKRALAAVMFLTSVTCGACSGAVGRVHVVPNGELPPIFHAGAHQAPRTLRVVVYLVQANRLVSVARIGQSSLSTAEVVMRALLRGPTEQERGESITTAIPGEADLLGVSVENKVATVDLSREFELGAEQEVFTLRLAQVVWSLTELPDVDKVSFSIDGQKTPVIDQDGNPHDSAARGRYLRFAPRNPEQPPIAEGPLVPDIAGGGPSPAP